MFIGQYKIIEKINNATVDTFPHSLLLVGEKGSGKHCLCNQVSSSLSLPQIDITDSISFDVINDIYLSVQPTIYVINGTTITEKKENVLLKFLEEPPKNSFIIILCENVQQLLGTIVNRCQVWYLSPYTKEELKHFTDDERILNIAITPGQIERLKNQDIDGIISLCNTIIDKIGNANYANVLTITNKISFDGTGDKIDIDCFIRYLLFTISSRLNQENVNNYSGLLRAYFLTDGLYNDRYIPHINMKNLFDKYLTEMKVALS